MATIDLLTANEGVKNAKKYFTTRSIMGAPLPEFKGLYNPAVFCSKGLVIMLYGHYQGDIEVIGIKPNDPGFVLSSGKIKCDYAYAVKCAEGWKGKKLCVVPVDLPIPNAMIIGDYDRANKRFTDIEYSAYMKIVEPVEGLIHYNLYLQRKLGLTRSSSGGSGVTFGNSVGGVTFEEFLAAMSKEAATAEAKAQTAQPAEREATDAHIARNNKDGT